MKIIIIIPAHNEEKRIAKTLEEYGKFFSFGKKNLRVEIVVVLNACKDDTLGIVKYAEKKYKNIRHIEFEQCGKGFAIMQGFKEALKGKPDLIGFVDADNATTPEAYYQLIKNINGYDGIFGSRYLCGAIVNPPPTISRLISSRIFNFLIRAFLLMPYRDTQCGAKIFRSEVLKKTVHKLGITKWAFDIDLLYQIRKEGFKLKEYPTVWSDKEYSKINLSRAGPQMFLAVIRLRLLNSPFRHIVEIYNNMRA